MICNVKEDRTSEFESYPVGEPMVYLGMRELFVYERSVKFKVVHGRCVDQAGGVHGSSLPGQPREPESGVSLRDGVSVRSG